MYFDHFHMNLRGIIYASSLLLSMALWSQRYVDTYDTDNEEVKSILGRGNDLNGFGSLDLKVTELAGDNGMIIGGYGGVLVNRRYFLGLAGYGLVSEVEWQDPDLIDSRPLEVHMGYGGIMIGGIIGSKKVVHLAIPVFLGAGSVEMVDGDFFPNQPNDSEFVVENTAFMILEPGAQVEVNITKSLRIAIGGSYRLISGVNLDSLSDDDLSGAAVNLSVKLGRF
jgi:hypothetical protein